MKSSRLFRRYIAVAAALCIRVAAAQQVVRPLVLTHPVQDKDFYLFSVLESDAAIARILAADKDISQIASERHDALVSAQKACKLDVGCMAKAFVWTDEEIGAVSFALDRLATTNAPVHTLVETQLRPSETYILFEKESPGRLLAKSWEVCARGLNDVLMVYGEGLPPRYPAIDSRSIDPKSQDVQQQLSALLSEEASANGESFFVPSLKEGLELLALNHRDEAGRHEPMETTVNSAALKATASTNWSGYPYSVIVVPGAGPSDSNTALSEGGRKRCALSAAAYLAHKAPFILLSGGYVHPAQTRFSEAIEMKRWLMEEYHIPESAIVLDPHARHTTTNMRNAAREIFRYHMPANKPALVVTDEAQTTYIASQAFADRCLRELGYMPYRIVRQNSATELVFLPMIESLQQDPMDPLDP